MIHFAPLLLALTQGPAVETAPSAGPDLLAVDLDGRPVPNVTLELVDFVRGTFERDAAPRRITTDAEGRAQVPLTEDGQAPIDIRVAEADRARFAVSFLHGDRSVVPGTGYDLLGREFVTLAPEGDVTLVLAEVGTLRLEIAGVAADQRVVATFMDERPEGELRRPVRTSRTFVGGEASLHLPPGRGVLYLAREGALGGLVVGPDGPLNVAISGGATTELRLAFSDGPGTKVLAPFESIPFEMVESLAPDAETVVGTFPFKTSPLRLPSSFAHVAGVESAPDVLARSTRAKALLRAEGIPLVRQQPGAYEGMSDEPPRLATAPLDLTFGVDVGGRLRLPEVDGGWIELAAEGITAAEGLTGPPRRSELVRARRGVLDLGNARGFDGVVRVVDAEGQPRPFTELMFATANAGVVRAITDAEGELSVQRVGATGVLVARLDDPLHRVGLVQNAPEATLVLAAAPVAVSGRWKGVGPGVPLGLVAADPAELDVRNRFWSAGFQVSVTDSDGRFHFGRVPAGRYRLQVMGGGFTGVEVPLAGPVWLELSGTRAGPTVDDAVATERR